MAQLNIEQTLQAAIGHHQAGRLPQAEALYRQVLAVNPRQPDALHFLGVLAEQSGHHAAAVELIGQAIAIVPGNAAFHANLGVAYGSMDKLEEAAACQERAVALQPNYPEALSNLGQLWHRLGRSEAALGPLGRAIALAPNFHDAQRNLGDVLTSLGRLEEALAAYRRAVALDPAHSAAYQNMGVALTRMGRPEEAIAAYRQAISATPGNVTARQYLADLLLASNRCNEAYNTCQAALAIDPKNAAVWCTAGHALKGAGHPDEAIAAYRKAIAYEPRNALAHANLGCALRDRGQVEEALAALGKAREIDPGRAAIHSNLIITLNLQADVPAALIAEEKRRWDERFVRPLAGEIRQHANEATPERRLRIGYVSPDFREHPVGRLMLRILEHHDRGASEVFCYSNSIQVDAFAERLRGLADQWRGVYAVDDARLAQRVRDDGIDILVDLAMHTINSRILVFARKPAPVQISYLAYPDGTGVSTMDYRLTDRYLDPPSADEGGEAFEKALRLPETYWCYAPAIATPGVNGLPALLAGHVTFGALNDFCKVTGAALELWARLLERLPGARLIMHVPTGTPHERVAGFFRARGIDGARLEFQVHVPLPQYFATYQRIDIALASFPYSGGTTMSDALWMGVPPISLAGATSISRAGLSVMSNVGLEHLVARSPEEYLEIAVRLAADLPGLAALRGGLRERVEKSPLGDAPRFVAALEGAYREAWRAWCAKHPSTR